MEHEVEYNNELSKITHTSYVRNSRAVTVMWALFHVAFTILNIVVFVQPQWIGDDGDSAVQGFFGLYRYCLDKQVGSEFDCQGDFLSWDSILNEFFKATTVMTALSCLLAIFVVMCFLLFCLLNAATVLRVCGWFQLLSGLLMTFTCAIYPSGWDHQTVQTVCGVQSNSYDLGLCSLRWGYYLAIVLALDGLIMSALAFVLAAKQAHLLPTAYDVEKKTNQELDLTVKTAPSETSHLYLNDSCCLSEFSFTSLAGS